MIARDWTYDDVAMFYELTGVYDGWSVAELKDGRLVNRWSAEDYPRRHAAAAEFIASLEADG